MIPKPIYETLPVIYIVLGIFAMTAVESRVSFFSGLIMALSGITVLYLRRGYRMQKPMR